jgi:hypothetical protein
LKLCVFGPWGFLLVLFQATMGTHTHHKSEKKSKKSKHKDKDDSKRKSNKKEHKHKRHKKHKRQQDTSSSSSSSDSDSGYNGGAGSALSQLERERAAVKAARYLLSSQQGVRKDFREVSCTACTSVSSMHSSLLCSCPTRLHVCATWCPAAAVGARQRSVCGAIRHPRRAAALTATAHLGAARTQVHQGMQQQQHSCVTLNSTIESQSSL